MTFKSTQQSYMLKKILFVGMLFSIYIFTYKNTLAAELSFGDVPPNISSQESFYIDVVLDTKGENVNAIEGTILFPDDLLEVKEIYNGRSVVTSWVKQPKVEGSSISFAGIMAGGFTATIDPVNNTEIPGNIFRVVFTPIKDGYATINFDDVHLYLNDGSGNEVLIQTRQISFGLSSDGQKFTDLIVDTTGPEAFTPIVSKNENLFGGQYFLVFDTKDVETGIDHFEVKEGGKDWVVAKSPYLLTNQSLRDYIQVKAIDNAGNVTYGSVGERYISYFVITIIVLVLVVVLIYFFIKRFKRKLKINNI